MLILYATYNSFGLHQREMGLGGGMVSKPLQGRGKGLAHSGLEEYAHTTCLLSYLLIFYIPHLHMGATLMGLAMCMFVVL